MLILTIETCTETSTLGLVRDGVVLGEAAFPSRYTLAKRLIPRLEWLLADSGLTKESVEAVAVSTGPGSFTGVRIGLAAAKTFACWAHIPLVGIPTLEALAFPFRDCAETLLVPLINARRQQAYVALYRGDAGVLRRITADTPLSAEPFHAVLQQHHGGFARTLIIGQAEGLPPAFHQQLGDTVSTVRSLVTPHALAQLAAERLAQGAADDAMTLAPIYLRSAAD
ncbi:MAG TPA: tRNA (adenosine(37)-N6)-threonylcarbamoyltransferase complex dimerization subunit type 1 TsaB [Armatimonadota bacterium]|jgi:tRNA threonylcarbamoyladenosine biosynthesis protein TsaB